MASDFSFCIKTDDGTAVASSGGDESQYNVLLKRVSTFRKLDKIGRAEISFICPSLACEEESPVLNAEPFVIGTKMIVEVCRSDTENAGLIPIFKGVVTRSELRAKPGQTEINLTLKDHAIALTRKRYSTIYQTMTDVAIAEELVNSEYESLTLGSLSADIEHEQIVQFSQSDWDSLLFLAHKNACLIAVDIDDAGNMLSFVDLKSVTSAGTLNTEQQNVLELCVGYNAENLYASATVDTWNLDDQAMNGEQKSESSEIALTVYDKALSEGSGILDEASIDYLVDAGLSEGEEKAVAEGDIHVLASSCQSGFIELSGDVEFNLGDMITLEKIAEGYRGPFLISAIEHDLSAEGWVTRYRFGMTLQDLNIPSVSHLKTSVGVADSGRMRFGNQLQLAVVDEYKADGKGQYRIPIKLITQSHESEAIWARVSMIEAGGGRGVIFWPEAGDEVVIGFVGNDFRTPVILGSLFSPTKNPVPETFEINEDNTMRGIVTKNAMKWRLDNENERQSLELDENNTSTFEKGTGLSFVVEKDFKAEIEGESALRSTKTISITTDDELTLESVNKLGVSSGAEIKIESADDISADSGGALTLKASKGLDLEAGQSLNAKGSTINLN